MDIKDLVKAFEIIARGIDDLEHFKIFECDRVHIELPTAIGTTNFRLFASHAVYGCNFQNVAPPKEKTEDEKTGSEGFMKNIKISKELYVQFHTRLYQIWMRKCIQKNETSVKLALVKRDK